MDDQFGNENAHFAGSFPPFAFMRFMDLVKCNAFGCAAENDRIANHHHKHLKYVAVGNLILSGVNYLTLERSKKVNLASMGKV